MNKAPSPSKLTISQLDQIMVYDSTSGMRYYNEGRIDKEAEAAEIRRNRHKQKFTNYKEYRYWYKGLSVAGRRVIAKDLGWIK